jgi:pimeloyl-ACP methyl ester carboxylesterase
MRPDVREIDDNDLTNLYTHDTVATAYVEADGVRFAYRRFGRTEKTPVAAFAHSTAARDFGRPSSDGYRDLQCIARPTLVVNGSDDFVIPTVDSLILQHIPNAKLVLYPDSGHGAHYQFHEDFVAQVKLFLDGPAGDRVQ